jgi:hypothetical protein
MTPATQSKGRSASLLLAFLSTLALGGCGTTPTMPGVYVVASMYRAPGRVEEAPSVVNGMTGCTVENDKGALVRTADGRVGISRPAAPVTFHCDGWVIEKDIFNTKGMGYSYPSDTYIPGQNIKVAKP